MILTVKGLVLRSIKYGESDKLITVLTEEGKLFFQARGIRSITSKNAAGCQTFVYSEFILDARGDKYFLRKAQPLYSTVKTGADLTVLSLASYFTELAEDTARDAETGKAVLRLLMNALFLLSKEDRAPDLIKAVFELRLLAANGLMPQLDGCAVRGKDLSADTSFFFRLTEGDLVCPTCVSTEDISLNRMGWDVLSLVRHSVEETEEKAYAVRVPVPLLKEFSRFAERYLLEQMERGYQTLDFYRDVKKLGPMNGVAKNESI